MPSYLVHASGERVRFRHGIFARPDRKEQAIEILGKLEGIAGIKAGANSLLLFLEPESSLKAICAKLEQTFPELAEAESESAIKVGRRRPGYRQKAEPSRAKSASGLKILLFSGSATLGLAIFGFHHLHALAGGIFSLFTIQHVWQRRRRL